MAQALLKVGFNNDFIAPPTAVGAFVRRELSGTDEVLRRRIDLAHQAATGVPPTIAMPLAGPAPQSTTPAGKNLAQTMVIPGRSLSSDLTSRFGKRRTFVVALSVALGLLAALLTAGIARHAAKASRRQAVSSTSAR